MHREDSDSPVLRPSRDAVGLDARRERLRRYDTWTPEDLAEFDEVLSAQRVVDKRDWR